MGPTLPQSDHPDTHSSVPLTTTLTPLTTTLTPLTKTLTPLTTTLTLLTTTLTPLTTTLTPSPPHPLIQRAEDSQLQHQGCFIVVSDVHSLMTCYHHWWSLPPSLPPSLHCPVVLPSQFRMCCSASLSMS
jgi:hypothetical protein